MTLVLRLPWPQQELSPNARPHWRRKGIATSEYRTACWVAARLAMGPPIGPPPVPGFPKVKWPNTVITAKVVFVVPDRRQRDLDNCMAMLKPCWDGLVDAGVLVDDDSRHLKLAAPEMRIEKGQKYVEVTLS